jgi:hypothetical protein
MNDFPNCTEYQDKLTPMDMGKFSKLNVDLIEQLEAVVESDIPRLLESLPGITINVSENGQAASAELLSLLSPSTGIIVLKHGKLSYLSMLLIIPIITGLYFCRKKR